METSWPSPVPTYLHIYVPFEDNAIGIPSITSCVLLVLILYIIYSYQWEGIRFKKPNVSNFERILLFVVFSVTLLMSLLQTLLPADTELVWDTIPPICENSLIYMTSINNTLTCSLYKDLPGYCGKFDEAVWEECPCVCNKTSICGNQDFIDSEGFSCLYYDENPDECGPGDEMYECCACNMSDKNNHTWLDNRNKGCMAYSIVAIFCGAYDQPGEQSAWEACPTFCNKSDILGDSDWVDAFNRSCLFYQEEVSADGLHMKSGSFYCGLFDRDVPAYDACDVCDIGRECQPDKTWRNDLMLGCQSYSKDITFIAPNGGLYFQNCGVFDKTQSISSWEACPCYCNWTQELQGGKRYPGWTDINGQGCAFYVELRHWCGAFDHPEENFGSWPGDIQSVFDACPYICNRSEMHGNPTWKANSSGILSIEVTCFWFYPEILREYCDVLPGARENCDKCSPKKRGDIDDFIVFINWRNFLNLQIDVFVNVSCEYFDYRPTSCLDSDSASETCWACQGDFRRLNVSNYTFGRVQKDLCVRGTKITYYNYELNSSTCFSTANYYSSVVGIGWNSSVGYCSLHSLEEIPTLLTDSPTETSWGYETDIIWKVTTDTNNQSVECFIRSESMGFCTEPTFRGTPNAECDCNDGYPCIFGLMTICEVACEDSWGVLEISGPTSEVQCKCPSGICDSRAWTDWELGKMDAFYGTIYYLGNEDSNGWSGITNVKSQTCFTVECPDIITCFAKPSGRALSKASCNYYNFYNTFAVGFCGFFMLLISFTGLARRNTAENLNFCPKCRQDEEDSSSQEAETLTEIVKRLKWKNTKLRIEATRTVILQFIDYAVDIWCAVDYWEKDRLIVSLLIGSTILFQICTTTITKHPWKNGGCLVPGIFYYTGLGLVHECYQLWNLSEYTLDLHRMIFITTLTEDVPSVAINISEIVAGNYWPMLQTSSLLISMLVINKNFLQYLTFYHSKSLVITTGCSLLFIGPFIITDELIRVTAVFGFFLKADLIHGAALIAANLALSGFFGYFFSRHSSNRFGYFLTYTLTLPLSGVLGLYAVLLNEPNGNIFFVEYFTRLCLNVALFSISCWSEAVEMPQQLLFTIVLYINVIFFIGITATLSKEVLYTLSVPQNVLSMHHTDFRKGIFFLPGMSPKISQKAINIIHLGEGDCSQTSSDDVEVVDTETTKKHSIDPKKKIFFLPGKSSKIRQKGIDNILYGEGDCSQTPSDELVLVDSETTECVTGAHFTIAENESVKTEPESHESLVAKNMPKKAGDENLLSVDVTSSTTSSIQKVIHFLKKPKIHDSVVLQKSIELQTIEYSSSEE